jgi:hypothetical protein
MNALLFAVIVVALGVWAYCVATYYIKNTQPTKSQCTGDCNQGRDCHCVYQEKMRLEDEFNNSNWPFPVKKP